MVTTTVLDRRQFIIAAAVTAGGMALGISTGCTPRGVPGGGSREPAGPWGPEGSSGNEFSAWIEIAPDSTVTVRVPNPESGTGAMTQVAMNIAEELQCAWSDVRAVTASIRRDYVENHVYTTGLLPFFSGHGTDPERMTRTLQLGASARERLKAAAARRWGVEPAEVEAKDSMLAHRSTGRTLRYGEVAAEAAGIELAAEPALKPSDQWWLLGRKSPSKLFLPEVVTGKAVFGIDVKLPGMVHAALMQAPVMGGKLRSCDAQAVLAMPGVRKVVIIDPANSRKSPVEPKTNFGLHWTAAQHGVAVIADHYWQAKTALDALPVEWDPGAGAEVATEQVIYQSLRAARDSGRGKVLRESGDIAAATGRRVVEAEYLTPYCENAVLEPLNGTALVTADAVEVWCSTQDSRQAFWVVVDETGMAPERVQIHAAYVGGNFGRRTQAEDLRMVVAIAREYPGIPVKVIWSREECFRQGRYRPPVATRFRAVLDDATGLPQAVSGAQCFGGEGVIFQQTQGYADPPYFTSGVIPNIRLTSTTWPGHVLIGAYRGPGLNSHAFITETFVDECAIAAGIDPVEYRLRLLARWDKPWSDVLRLAAAKAGWGRKLPKGEGLGIAITSWPIASRHDFGTIMAAAAHVAVDSAGHITVKQVDVAFDCGRVAHADAVRAQIEGGVLFGLNMTLNEEMTLRNGAMVESNFHEYPVLRMGDHLPRINIHFDALSGHDRFAIVGEVPTAPIGPAVGNAIYQATGRRLRSTPFRKHFSL